VGVPPDLQGDEVAPAAVVEPVDHTDRGPAARQGALARNAEGQMVDLGARDLRVAIPAVARHADLLVVRPRRQ